MTAKHFAGFIAEDRLEATSPFLTLDVNLSREVEISGVPLTLTLGAKNLTDEFQEDLDQGASRDSDYVYGPRFPRQVFAGVKVELGGGH
jgi:outer membrane receptor for ferrienterochelin and colicins